MARPVGDAARRNPDAAVSGGYATLSPAPDVRAALAEPSETTALRRAADGARDPATPFRRPITESPDEPMDKDLRNKLLIGVAVVIAIAAAGFLLPIGEWVKSLEGWIKGLGAFGVVAFVVLYVLATITLVPASAFTILAGLAYGAWGVPLVVVSATIGACLAFLIGRHLARERVKDRVQGNDRLKAVDKAVAQEGWKVVGLLRLSPVFPFGLQNYFFGITEIGFLPYALATFFGIIPGTALYVYLGAIGKAGGGGPAQWAFLIAGLIATAVVVWLVTRRAKAALEDIT